MFFLLFNRSVSHKDIVTVCSKYSFHREVKDWNIAKKECSNQGNGLLASMETEKEWLFVKNLTKEREKTRWFIGLKRVDGFPTWCWCSKSIVCVNGTSTGTWRWNTGEPNQLEKEKCVEMWKNGVYNNIECEAARYDDNPGYICEKQVSKFMITPNLC